MAQGKRAERLIAAGVVVLIAFVDAQLAAMFPKSGERGMPDTYAGTATVAALSPMILRLALAAAMPDEPIRGYYRYIIDEFATGAVWRAAPEGAGPMRTTNNKITEGGA
ncbi:MAG TPA: hypothetical protein VFL54_04085 [Gammaproteobacteria bacterium]|nr:hypothetical protein [Gammaproteobacteria bacterium]